MPTLDWIGKRSVIEHHRDVPFRLLRENSDLSAGDAESGNLLVRGDNLHALKALLPYYAGRVKCIYIDPPYNTGNEGWVYNDNVNSPAMRAWLGEAVGKKAEDLSRHDKWLCMMYPRLVLLRKLLREDGAIFVSIDDNAVHYLRALMDEIWGSRNFISNVVWHKRISPANDATYFSSDHDHILVYAKNAEHWVPNRLKRTEAQLEYYKNPDNDPRGPWNSAAYTCAKSADERPNLYYAITNPNTGKEVWPSRDRVWAYDQVAHKKNVEADLLYWGKDGTARMPRKKKFLSSARPVVARSIWSHREAGHNQEAKLEIRRIMGTDRFSTPKPTRLIRRMLQIATGPNDLVLDSFAGTGTTGHAVLEQNARDGGDRRFILVEMEDAVAESVTAQRLRRVIEGYEYEGTERTELMREKLTVTNFKNADEILARMDALKEEHAGRYDGFERRIDKDHIVLYGKKKIDGTKPGLGGGFRFFDLGAPVFGSDGRIRQSISFEDLARHVYFAQTGRPLPDETRFDSPLVGTAGGTGVYLLYNGVLGDVDPKGGNVLTRRLLRELPPHEGPKAIYGTACALSDAYLSEHGISFHQIPYDIPAG